MTGDGDCVRLGRRLLLPAFLLVLGCSAQGQTPTLILRDGDFASADWVTRKLVDTSSSGSFSVSTETLNGNPGAFRLLNQDLQSGTLTISDVPVNGMKLAYSPKDQGAILNISYSYDVKVTSGAAGATYQIALYQNGSTYVEPGSTITNSLTAWHSIPVSPRYSNRYFTKVDGMGPVNPDFSESGATIYFGYLATVKISQQQCTSYPYCYGSTRLRPLQVDTGNSSEFHTGIDNLTVNIFSGTPGVGCEVVPINTYLGFHLPSLHLSDPAHNPDHVVAVNVTSSGSPAPSVSVTMTATRPIFSKSSSELPSLTTATATTDSGGVAHFVVSPPAANTFDETDIEAMGSVGSANFDCKGSIVTGLGTISALMQPAPAGAASLFRGFAGLFAPLAGLLDQLRGGSARPASEHVPGTMPKLQAQAMSTVDEVLEHLKRTLAQAESPRTLAVARAGPRIESERSYGSAPLRFEFDQSVAGEARYTARGEGYRMHFGRDEIGIAEAGDSEQPVWMRFSGANQLADIRPLEKLLQTNHYFLGTSSRRPADVPAFAKIMYKNVYPGVDVVFHGHRRELELDFVVAPGVRPEKIGLAFDGIERLDLNSAGDLVLHRTSGDLWLHKPFVYQEHGGARQAVAGRFVLSENKHVSFQVDAYDERQALVIDPVVSYASFLGGGTLDGATAVAVDAQGNTYIAGSTTSTDFPLAKAVQQALAGLLPLADVFVTKINSHGEVVYSTYVGGSGNDIAMGIAVDASGSVYVTGATNSPDFPVVNPIQPKFGGGPDGTNSDGFVFKLDPSGSSLLYSTYIGGSQEDVAVGIAVDGSGSAYISGITYSADFPVKNALQSARAGSGATASDTFVAKLSSNGSSLVYSTYLGGTGGDSANAIAVDSAGNAYITGATDSSNFPTAKAIQQVNGGGSDAFVAKLNAAGSALVYSTYLGGKGDDVGWGIAVDSSGNAYVTGGTGSPNFPLKTPAQTKFGASTLTGLDAFVTKLSSDGSSLTYSTFLGGSGVDQGWGIAVGSDGAAYVVGETTSSDFPAIAAVQSAISATESAAGASGGFLAKVNSAGSAFSYSTTIGGAGADTAQAVAVGPTGVYVAGITLSKDFPLQYGAKQARLRGRSDAMLLKIVEGTPTPQLSSVQAANLEPAGALAPESIVSGFGQGLSIDIAGATTSPLPLTLANTSVTVKDSAGNQQPAPLFFVSPTQINYLVPSGLENGLAQVTVSSGSQTKAIGTIQLESVAPGLFSANADGRGAAAGIVLRVAANGSQTTQLVYTCGSTAGSCVPAPIDLGNGSEQIFLLVFGTGIRGASALSAVSATVGDQAVAVQYAGSQGGFAGLDQVNLGPLPASLKGHGPASVVLTVDGDKSNTVDVIIQ